MFDHCPACLALLEEYGTMDYAQTFLDNAHRKGWAGGLSQSEKGWMMVHGPEWYLRAVERGKLRNPFQQGKQSIAA